MHRHYGNPKIRALLRASLRAPRASATPAVDWLRNLLDAPRLDTIAQRMHDVKPHRHVRATRASFTTESTGTRRALRVRVMRFLGNGRYVLGEQLGVGGMGAVYAAEDLLRTERVAIKVAHSESIATDVIATHMARELEVGRATNHPNVVRMLDGGFDGGQPYVVMELAHGRSLSALAADGDLSVRRVVGIVDQILAGLTAIHRAGYLHGDVKTDNVLVTTANDGGDLVKVIDLGLACRQDVRLPAEDERMLSGTPQYLAPEVVLGGAKSVVAELYAVGVILYELLTGTTPFSGRSILDILRQHVDSDVMRPSARAPELKLSLALEDVVLRALEKTPAQRYSSAAELRAALRAAMTVTRDEPIARASFSTTGATVEWTRPALPPRPRALGTNPPAARGSGRDPQVFVDAALEATRKHVSAHRLGVARDELESALRSLEEDGSGEHIAWRLLLALSAVCDGLRDSAHARRLARLALDGAARAGSEVGRRRAKQLIERFAGRGRVSA